MIMALGFVLLFAVGLLAYRMDQKLPSFDLRELIMGRTMLIVGLAAILLGSVINLYRSLVEAFL